MHFDLAARLASVLLPAAPVSTLREAPRKVTRYEYALVSPGVTGAPIERSRGAEGGFSEDKG